MNIRSIADKTGVIGSVVCAIHCLAGPIVLLVLPIFPISWTPDESFHEGMLWILIPTGIIAFSLGCRKHKDTWTIVLGITGMLGLLLAAIALHDVLGETGERIITVVAAALLIKAHIRNFKLCIAAECRHDYE